MVAAHPRRNSVPDPYEGMQDHEVLAIAQGAGLRAQALSPRSSERRAEWVTFDKAMGELMRRAMSHALWKIHEREAGLFGDAEAAENAAAIIGLVERNGDATAEPDGDDEPIG